MGHGRDVALVIVAGAVWVLALSGCGSMKSAASAVPGASYIPGLADDESGEPQEGDKLHLQISPDEALAILADVAPQHGWTLAAVGEQHDLQGLRGKYFRLETTRFLGGATEMNGVFFIEPQGTYVIVGKRHTGLPEELVEPFTLAVKEKTATGSAEAAAVSDEEASRAGEKATATDEAEAGSGETEAPTAQ